MTLPWIEKTLDRLGLWNAIRGIPGLVAIVVPSVALTYFALSQLAVPAHIIPFAAAILGVLLSLIGYYAGNFWDSSMFDPRYGVKGRWLDRETRPYHLFPAGTDLERCPGRQWKNSLRLSIQVKGSTEKLSYGLSGPHRNGPR